MLLKLLIEAVYNFRDRYDSPAGIIIDPTAKELQELNFKGLISAGGFLIIWPPKYYHDYIINKLYDINPDVGGKKFLETDFFRIDIIKNVIQISSADYHIYEDDNKERVREIVQNAVKNNKTLSRFGQFSVLFWNE